METYLRQYAEAVPDWLADHVPGKPIDMKAVLNSRTLFYPGSGDDGQPLATFNRAQCVHVFLYVDYWLTKEELEEQLAEAGFHGYHQIDQIELGENDLTPKGWRAHINPGEIDQEWMRRLAGRVAPYCIMKIFERNDDADESVGSKRFAVIFLCGDGIASYDAVYGNKNAEAPFALVLQDHGFGGNYASFGDGGLLEKVAQRAGVFPKLILGAIHCGTEMWDGFKRIPGLNAKLGGMHHTVRLLFKKP